MLAEAVHSPLWAWGVVPYVCYVTGFLVPVAVWEAIIAQPFARSSLIGYGKAGRRADALAGIQAKPGLSWGTQLRGALSMLFGPAALLNVAASAVLLPLLVPAPQAVLPTWPRAALQFAALQLVGDFGLYWGHRVQHEVPVLWERFHRFHHQVLTPTPVTTLFIHPVDATLQGGLPIVLSAAVVRPHPVVFWAYVWLRVAENVTNHSGLSGALVHAITLKALPLRCGIAHHDSHHRYSNHAGRAKNYGENFWIWDWAFDTLRADR